MGRGTWTTEKHPSPTHPVRCNFIALPVFGLRYNTSDVERKFGGSNTQVYCSPKTGSVMRLIRASNQFFLFPTCCWMIALPPLHPLQPHPLPPAITAQMYFPSQCCLQLLLTMEYVQTHHIFKCTNAEQVSGWFVRLTESLVRAALQYSCNSY